MKWHSSSFCLLPNTGITAASFYSSSHSLWAAQWLVSAYDNLRACKVVSRPRKQIFACSKHETWDHSLCQLRANDLCETASIETVVIIATSLSQIWWLILSPPFTGLSTVFGTVYTYASLEKEMATHFIILAWRIPWQKSLAGYSRWGGKESDLGTEHTHTYFSFSMLKGLLPGQLFCFQTRNQQIPHITLRAGPCLPHLSLLQSLPWFPAHSRSSRSGWYKVMECAGGLGWGWDAGLMVP